MRAYAHAHDDHYLTRSKVNSLLTEMITPQTYKYIYIHIKPLPVPRVFGARSGSPRINFCKVSTSGDENHLCGASLCQSHKIPHRYACAHGVGTPIARTEKLPQQ